MSKTDDKRAQRGTIALFIASGVLAVVGVTLLVGVLGPETSPSTASTSTTAAASTEAASRGSASRSPAPSTPSTATAVPSQSAVAVAPRQVPVPMQETARAFVSAWASHDARPGRDVSYDDASRRAAAYAGVGLAEDLRSYTSGSSGRRQWTDWKERQVRVTVMVLRVSLPDGAPAPSEDSGLAQVIYKVTEKPASGPAVNTEQHVALKLRRGTDGTWRVVGLPNV